MTDYQLFFRIINDYILRRTFDISLHFPTAAFGDRNFEFTAAQMQAHFRFDKAVDAAAVDQEAAVTSQEKLPIPLFERSERPVKRQLAVLFGAAHHFFLHGGEIQHVAGTHHASRPACF